MSTTFLVAAVIGGILVVWRLLPRITEATRQGPWLGAYKASVKRGMSPTEAIAAALKPLRYRQPWQALSDDDVTRIAGTLGQLDRPELFTEALARVERTGDLGQVADEERLRQFVAAVNARDKNR